MPYGDGSRSDDPVPGKAMLKAAAVGVLFLAIFLGWLWMTGKG